MRPGTLYNRCPVPYLLYDPLDGRGQFCMCDEDQDKLDTYALLSALLIS